MVEVVLINHIKNLLMQIAFYLIMVLMKLFHIADCMFNTTTNFEKSNFGVTSWYLEVAQGEVTQSV